MVRIKRIYLEPDPGDGLRVLVDRLWPRGLSRERAQVARWERELAPSDELRRWFGHDPARWEEFRKRYLAQLQQRQEVLEKMAEEASRGTVTLLYAARDEERNNAAVVRELLEKMRRS